MKKRTILIVICVLFLFNLSIISVEGTIPKISNEDSWTRTWGFEAENEWGNDVALDSSSNIYITGHTNSSVAKGWEILLLKYNSSGDLQWNATWGGSDSDQGSVIRLDSANNIFVGGSSESFGAGDRDIILVKFDNSGNYLWHRTWGGSEHEYNCDIAIDSFDNVYLAGSTRSFGPDLDVFLAKYNNSGDLVYNITWSGIGNDYTSEVALDTSGNIFIAGDMEGLAFEDVTIVKFNNSGDYQWHQSWGGDEFDFVESLSLDSFNNIYVAGSFYSYGSETCIVKFNSTGHFQWYRTWDGNGNVQDLIIDSQDNIYLSGFYKNDMFFIKYDQTGTLLDSCIWGSGLEEDANGIEVDSLGNIYVTGVIDLTGNWQHDVILCKNPQSCKSLKDPTITGYLNFIIFSIVSITTVMLVKIDLAKKQQH
jgi:uncharacterized delta-60 repeat protein